jgi:hypothetical protein
MPPYEDYLKITRSNLEEEFGMAEKDKVERKQSKR